MARSLTFAVNLARQEEGATVIEYALFIALITMACVAAMSALGVGISDMFNRMDGKLNSMAT
jgi:Flp pilus assembly pilin Flp